MLMTEGKHSAYEAAGVQIEKGYEAVERMKKHIQRTNRPEVMSQVGGFGGLFDLSNHKDGQPILVSGTDGVGTKIILAQQSKTYDTIGIDCVAMCVNDVLAQGAEPLFFLDYLAVGQNDPQTVEAIVSGVAQGCVEAGAALIGGETAEMPDVYGKEDFDLAGFCVGIVDREKMLDKTKVEAGHVLVGIPSSGIHSNGFSLVRKVFFKDNDWQYDQLLEDGKSLIDHLLTPTRIYVNDLLPLLKQGLIKGLAHITGGGFPENLPRMFDETTLTAHVDTAKWQPQPIFSLIQELGHVSSDDMYQVFNMGIGMVAAVAKEDVETVCQHIPDAVVIGEMSQKVDDKDLILTMEESN